MKLIQRDLYLNQLISRKENGLIKTITGLRRSGKSFLLFKIFHNHLLECGVKEENIITLALDDDLNREYRNPWRSDKGYLIINIFDLLLNPNSLDL